MAVALLEVAGTIETMTEVVSMPQGRVQILVQYLSLLLLWNRSI